MSAVMGAVLCAMPSATARADDATQSLGAEVAVVASSARDDLIAPLASSGGGLSLGAEYLGEAGPGLLDVSARLGLAAGEDRVGAVGLAVEHGIGLRYLVPLPAAADWRTAFGPALGADADVFYFADWDDAHEYWMGATWLGAGGRGWRPLGRAWRLAAAGELGLVGLVGRPHEYRMNKQDPSNSPGFWLVDVYRDPEPAWIGNWQLARARIEFSRSSEESFVTRSWRFGLEARLARADEPQPAFALAVKLVLAKGWGW